MELMDVDMMGGLDTGGMADASTIQKLEDLLLVAVPRDLTDSDVLQLRRLVLENVRRYRSRWVLLDFSRVDICDSFFGRFIQSTARMAGLMGSEVIISGLQDAVVETMVELGMTLSNVYAVLDLDDALALSRERQHTGGPIVELAELADAPAGEQIGWDADSRRGDPFADYTDWLRDDGADALEV
jgi:rsbT antagonist protein RsbS